MEVEFDLFGRRFSCEVDLKTRSADNFTCSYYKVTDIYEADEKGEWREVKLSGNELIAIEACAQEACEQEMQARDEAAHERRLEGP